MTLQSDDTLKAMYQNKSLLDSYRVYESKEELPNLRAHALKCSSVFGSTYLCEQFLSKMNIPKSRYRSKLTDENLRMQLRVATSSARPNIEHLVKQVFKNLTKAYFGNDSLIFDDAFFCYFLLFYASISRYIISVVWFALFFGLFWEYFCNFDFVHLTHARVLVEWRF